jgi:hypothetical protein
VIRLLRGNHRRLPSTARKSNQGVEFWVLVEVGHDERADRHNDQPLMPRKIQRCSRELCGYTLVTEHGRYLGVIENQLMRGIIVIAKHRVAFRKSRLEAVFGGVVLDHNGTGSCGGPITLFIHVRNCALISTLRQTPGVPKVEGVTQAGFADAIDRA